MKVVGAVVRFVAVGFISVAVYVALNFEGERVAATTTLQATLVLPPESVASLRSRPRNDVAGLYKFGVQPMFAARIHLKGDASFSPIDERPSFTVKPIKTNGKETNWLQRKFYLNNNYQDHTFCRDLIARFIFNRLGVPTPTVGHTFLKHSASLETGIYTVAEGVTKDFLGRSFRSREGALFEGERQDCILKMDANSCALAGQLPVFPMKFTDDLLFPSPFSRSNLMGYIAAEYLTSHGDGYIFALNNYWVYQPIESGECFMFPHTLDSAFRASYWVLTQRIVGRAAAALLRDEAARQTVRLLVKEQCTPDAERELMAFIDVTTSNLLCDVLGALDRSQASRLCHDIQLLRKHIAAHRAALVSAQRLHEGTLDATDDFQRAERWTYGNSQRALFDDMRHTVSIELTKKAEFCQTYVLVRPGRYRWTQRLQVSGRHRSGGIPLDVYLQALGDSCTVMERTSFPHSVIFAVRDSSAERLFSVERVRLRIVAAEAETLITLNLSEGRLERIGD